MRDGILFLPSSWKVASFQPNLLRYENSLTYNDPEAKTWSFRLKLRTQKQRKYNNILRPVVPVGDMNLGWIYTIIRPLVGGQGGL